ncbi:3-deoxy-D-manno-octulosonate 8-phosphate phosphatase (KDO 8-P phosphatase) [Ferrimonas sediminum]|uniref:3-deoxy-D-manno-octulosonate 8-phosphate phosphatase KdsC n=1 Tax=Ferrimonas sediminum TaxID=718193 RepID=A0A1G8KBZ3_9GAMM|nr:3-deoxy-manno-octulosonate-8-phosphatase KdsC [Ferrimonas sediminum]SDI40938.1 3-deoxy-D-manno-octulosonate 8-phosphate phosphatase (KDO 8-P phosphatase) [Ferrimonas sediminum]
MNHIDTLYGPVSQQAFELAKGVRLLVCDVDGVFSDGRIYLGNNGEELKAFHTRDGFGIKALQASGVDVAVITGRKSDIVQRRMTALGVKHIHQGVDNKIEAYEQLKRQLNVSDDQCAYIGDDLVDTPVMTLTGLSVAVNDAHPLVRKQATLTTVTRGGFGAVRELCDLIMAAQGTLEHAQGMSV